MQHLNHVPLVYFEGMLGYTSVRERTRRNAPAKPNYRKKFRWLDADGTLTYQNVFRPPLHSFEGVMEGSCSSHFVYTNSDFASTNSTLHACRKRADQNQDTLTKSIE